MCLLPVSILEATHKNFGGAAQRRCEIMKRSLVILLWAFSFSAQGQDLLNDVIEYSGLDLDVVEFVQMPAGQHPILSMMSPTFDDRLYVSSSLGGIYAVDETPDGNVPQLWFDARRAVRDASGLNMNYVNGQHGGLRSFAPHPEFESNGKLYLSFMQDRPADPSQFNYLGNSESAVAADSVLAEFTFDHETGTFQTDSYRELFRVSMPVYDHPIKQIKFNQFAQPGDEDYGLLYVTHGDASVQSAIAGGGQNRDDALGKILRIDPLADGAEPYSIPNSPFADDDATLDEIYALGLRNPHNLSFAFDDSGTPRLVVADIGRSNIEEINIIDAGGDYGWSSREGTFRHLANGGSINGVRPLPDNDAEFGYIYPAVQFDHDSPPGAGYVGVAVAGAHVIDNGSELDGHYIFGDFGNSGRIFHSSWDEMQATVTQLDPANPDADEPDELTQAQVSLSRLHFDHDQNPLTESITYDRFSPLLGASRSDFRFGEGSEGELYISSKRTGRVYLVTNSLPELLGDFDFDRRVDADDIDLLVAAIDADVIGDFDMTADGEVTQADVDELITGVLNTARGDADLDGEVAFADFLLLSAKFGQPGGWGDGDFDGNGLVQFADFLMLSANFGSGAAVAAVPEPAPVTFAGYGALLAIWWLRGARRKSRLRG